MIIIVGLGNPGKKFENTRHNVGFLAVDFFAKKNNFPEFKLSKKYDSLISESNGIILAKPQTFMNESGRAVKKLVSNVKGSASAKASADRQMLIVVHDDIDLPLGTIKIVKARGSAGHKGVESIIQNIGNNNMVRFRIGIQPHNGKPKNSENPSSRAKLTTGQAFVIKKFIKEERTLINASVEKIANALDLLISEGLEKTMNEYNR